jgi:hypothetical protein
MMLVTPARTLVVIFMFFHLLSEGPRLKKSQLAAARTSAAAAANCQHAAANLGRDLHVFHLLQRRVEVGNRELTAARAQARDSAADLGGDLHGFHLLSKRWRMSNCN